MSLALVLFAVGMAGEAVLVAGIAACLGLLGSTLLPRRGRSPARMPRRHRLLVMALAVLSIVNVISLSTWHSAQPGHDDAEIADALDDHHGYRLDRHHDGDPATPKLDLHYATHSAIHDFSNMVPSTGMIAWMPTLAAVWLIAGDIILSGIHPEALLRPPRD